LRSSCLHLLSAGVTGVYYHAQPHPTFIERKVIGHTGIRPLGYHDIEKRDSLDFVARQTEFKSQLHFSVVIN
jgi:cytosine/adenosine deaminase-related metal-dependent hydrolase